MDTQGYNDGLGALRAVRDDIKKVQTALDKLLAKRTKQVKDLATYAKAKPERIAPAAGLSVLDVVTLAPNLAPEPVATPPAIPSRPRQTPSAPARTGTPTPNLAPVPSHIESTTVTAELQEPREPEADHAPAEQEAPSAPSTTEPADAPSDEPVPRELPSIPDGQTGDRWFRVADNLKSGPPKFTQNARPTGFLDADTGVLVYRNQEIRLNLGAATADEILTAVFASVPDTLQRIYITGGAPWHREAARYRYLTDAVKDWLNVPMPHGWSVETQRGKDSMAGHFIHERRPVGRWQRGDQHVEIRSVDEWFDPEGASPATVRTAFTHVWKALKSDWPDVVLMGSPSQTGRDLWTRTISTKSTAEWDGGYPVMSDEIRQLLHTTSGQGRTELIAPPRVPEMLPRLAEYDRTLAYGKHTWTSGVGAPERITARTYASWSEQDQKNALFKPSHWQVRVTIPHDWNHVGILPAAIEGDRSWSYPHEAGRTFVTWAGGAEINLALRNPVAPWRIEILDGLKWKEGTPLQGWSDKLKKAWAGLLAAAQHAGTDELRESYRLAARAVRSILLYGIGGFAQRPTLTTGTVPVGEEHRMPQGAIPKSIDNNEITWERSQMSRNPYAHPEWAAGVWSAARAALLSTRAKTADGQPTHVGALHLPPGSIVAFRTDAIYTTAAPDWAYHGEPGEYRLKGLNPEPVTAPTDDPSFLTLQALGRARLEELQGQA